ncbi:hypothetical protein N480_15950 [Pseudoalteromonas luteoviolacea S2607]|uniref:hypothetical protein n=1 Tax=Pseudoalteromonas luteoviolacea TaxID=43657 RepID=UPI0007B0ADAE|nr:hypothetical protein [Pseudoalteromonas luteoviolacea]KZN36762.1 hypothetical protein N480_15950 [Pseudoalteromonas luteoviolacea S2607]
MIDKLTKHLHIAQSQSTYNHKLSNFNAKQASPAAAPQQAPHTNHDYTVSLSSPEENALKETELEAALARPIILGFGRSYTQPHVTITGLGTDEFKKDYRLGELTNKAEVEDFLAQVDRLPPEQRHKFQHLKPTRELLELTKKLSDEDLAKFADVIVATATFDPKTGRFNNISQDLIQQFNTMSEEVLSSAINTMSHLLEQGQAYDFSSPSPPLGILDDEGREDALLTRYDEGHNILSQSFGMQKTANVHRYATLLLDNKLSDGQLLELNAHLDEGDFQTNVGIVDMAKTIKPYQQDSFFAMLNETDKSNTQNIFALVSKQLDWREHKHYLQSDTGEFAVNHDSLTSDSERQTLYSNMLKAYDEVGLSWMNEVIDLTHDVPAKTQSAIWQTLMADLEENPNAFIHSDSIERWVNTNLDAFVHGFVEQQIKDIRNFNQELESPFHLPGLSYVHLEKQQDTVQKNQAPIN